MLSGLLGPSMLRSNSPSGNQGGKTSRSSTSNIARVLPKLVGAVVDAVISPISGFPDCIPWPPCALKSQCLGGQGSLWVLVLQDCLQQKQRFSAQVYPDNAN